MSMTTQSGDRFDGANHHISAELNNYILNVMWLFASFHTGMTNVLRITELAMGRVEHDLMSLATQFSTNLLAIPTPADEDNPTFGESANFIFGLAENKHLVVEIDRKLRDMGAHLLHEDGTHLADAIMEAFASA
jgi:hypothetical protein